MATDRIVNEDKQIRDVAQQLTSNTPAVIEAITQRATALGIGVPSSIGDIVTFVVTLATAASADAVAKDQEQGIQKTGASGPQLTRDDAATALMRSIREDKRALIQYFGAATVATAFPRGQVPSQPDKLLVYATQAQAALTSKWKSWSPANPKTRLTIDVGGLLTDMQEQIESLKAALSGVSAEKGAGTGALSARNQAEVIAHEQHKGLVHVAIGLFELAGLHELADHATSHHHLGHHVPTSDAKPAEADATATPAPKTGGSPK